MGMNTILYISEFAILAVALIAGLVFFEVKHKKNYLKFLGISIGIFIFAFGLTFLLEKPEMKLADDENSGTIELEVGSSEQIKMPETKYHFGNVLRYDA